MPAKAFAWALQGLRPPSLASQLLQGFGLGMTGVHGAIPVGAGLPAKASAWAPHGFRLPSPASRLLHGILLGMTSVHGSDCCGSLLAKRFNGYTQAVSVRGSP